MDLTKTNMTGIFTFVCAVILSTCVSNPFAHARQEITIDLQVGEQTFIQSPNYPSYYPRNADVGWLVKVPQAYQVMLRFNFFKTEKKKDIVTVRDGWTSDYSRSTWRASPSGISVPPDIISRGPYLWVNFTSNNWIWDKGFRAQLSAELRTITLNTEGTEVLTSPNYPEIYENNIDTIWYVRAPAGYRVFLCFSNFTTEEERYDTVTVKDGWTSNYLGSTKRASIFGQSIPDNITSISSHLWIQFTSDRMYGDTGFRALLNAVIPAIMLNTEGTEVLTSPNYPEPYDNNIDAIWYVRAPAGYRVLLYFSNFTTEERYDTVTACDGWTSDYSRSTCRPSLFGQSIPDNITSISSHLWIQFTSTGMYGNTGFRALLHAMIPVIILQTNETQILTSPNFPSSYDNNIDVVWHVRAPSGYRIMVHFTEFNTEPGGALVYVFDGKTSEYQSSGQRETISGQSVSRNITTVGAYLWIRFTSDNWNNNYYTGFNALLTTVETTVIMLDTTETEKISSPNFPVYYDNNIDIAFQVIAPAGYRVQVHFRHFETKENSDFVYIYEGWTSDFSRTTLRASLSGWSIPENITSIGSYLWIRFASNEGSRFRGFQALLNAKIPVIYLNHGNTEYLQSPNYPAQYGTNLNLIWHAIAPENHQVEVHFVDFWVETFRDFLYLYEGRTSEFEGSTLIRHNISGTYSPNDITIRGPFLWIRFTSDDGSQGGYTYTGFNISLFATLMPAPTTLTSTMHPTTTQPSTHASTSVIPSPSSTKVGSASKKSPRSHQPVLAISLVAVAVFFCVCVAGYIRWRKRLSSKRTPPEVSHAYNNGTGNSRDSRSVNHQPPTPDLLTSHHASSRRSNSYMRPETICPTPEPFLDNEYEELDDGRNPFDGAVGGMSLPCNASLETHVSSLIPAPYNHLAANPAQGKKCEEYEAVDKAIPNYDTRASLNRNDFNNPATSPDDDIETPAYFTLESRVADDEVDNFADYQEVGETSFNEPDVAESSARESQRSCLTRQRLKRSSTPVNDESGLTKLDDEFINQYQNDEIAPQSDTVDREFGWTYKQKGTSEGMDRNVTLNDEEEYDSLNFRSPSDLKSRLSKRSLQSSFGQADEETGKNVYDALDLQRPSHLSDPATDTMYNDNVYGTLTEMESDVDGWAPESRMHTGGQLGPLENNGRKSRESKSESCQDFGKKEGATQHGGHVETHGSRRQGRCVAPRTSPKTLNPADMPGKDDTPYSADEEYEKKSNGQIPEAEGVYENQFGLQISLDEEQPIYENTGGLSSGASETEDDYANLDYRNVGKEEAYDAIDQNIPETSTPTECDSIYSNCTY